MANILEHRFLEIIKKHLSPQDKIAVAVSGGPDSMTLLHLLLKTKKEIPLEVFVAHLNHGLRGKESDRDEIIVKNFCASKKIPFISQKTDVMAYAKKHKMNIEEAARELRYDFLQKVKEAKKARYIVLAHQEDDQIETILHNFIRGTGLQGLCGMTILKNDILRPLLFFPKKEILKYIKSRKIPFVIDKTNNDTSMTRNFLRKKVIPLLKKLNPSLGKTLAKNSSLISEIKDFLEGKTKKWVSKNISLYKTNIKFHKKDFLSTTKALQKSILQNLTQRILQTSQNFPQEKIENLIKFIEKSASGHSKSWSTKMYMWNEFGNIIMSQNKPIKHLHAQKNLPIPGKVIFHDHIIETKVLFSTPKNQKNSQKAYLNFEKIQKKPLYVRTFIKGDRFQPLGMKTTKKLKKFFIDEKIPLSKRYKCPLIVNKKNEILSIGALRIAEPYRLTPKTRKVLKISFTASALEK